MQLGAPPPSEGQHCEAEVQLWLDCESRMQQVPFAQASPLWQVSAPPQLPPVATEQAPPMQETPGTHERVESQGLPARPRQMPF